MNMRLDQLAGLDFAGVVALGAAHKLRVGKHGACMFGQAQQHAELSRRQRQCTLGQRGNLTPGIELERANSDQSIG